MERGVGGKRVWGLRMIGSAMKEGEVCNVAVYFGEEIGGVINEAGKEDKAEELLTGPLLHPV
jgi:hypothetical protein